MDGMDWEILMKTGEIILLVTALVLLGTSGAIGTVRIMKQTRGTRNKNPLNIEKGTKWQGLSIAQSDPRFATFLHERFGFRAGARILNTYYDKYGLNTIEGIITRWAPPSENDTPAYINFVSRKTGIPPNSKITDADYPKLLQAMAKMETGNEYSEIVIKEGVALA